MPSEPTLAVVLCTYNGEQYLSQQLSSLSAQTRLPELLLVKDDQSTDSTVEILERFKMSAPFPVEITRNSERLGYNANFASIIARADADLIALCDQDDVWYPEKLSVLYDLLSKDMDAAAACADARCVDSAGRPTGTTVWETMRFTADERSRMRRAGDVENLLRYNVISGHSMMIRSSYRDLLLPISEHGFYDYWLALLVQSVSHFVFAVHALSDYRVHGENAVGLSGTLSVRGIVSGNLREEKGSSKARTPLSTQRRTVQKDREIFSRDLLERLEFAPYSVDSATRDLVARWAEFCSFRSSLAPSPFGRIVPIIRELSTGNYGSFAKYKSAVYDLVLG